MSYAPRAALNDFVTDPRRVLLGTIVAPFLASLATEIPTFEFRDFWTIFFLGLFSVVTLFLPLALWGLRRTRHSFLWCVVAGVLGAPGIFGYATAIMGSLAMSDPRIAIMVPVVTSPLGAIGGAVFWLCAVWRREKLTG